MRGATSACFGARWLGVVVVGLVALLVVSAAPASAAGTNNYTFNHSTDTDFNAGTLTGGATVEGSGESANVLLYTAASDTTNFAYTGGSQTYDVPNAVSTVDVTLDGAEGGGGDAGAGAQVAGELPVTGGETLRVYVGGQGGTPTGGWNGGGDGLIEASPGTGAGQEIATSGGGGGATDIRQGGTALADRVAVAGGGGGDADSEGSQSTSDDAGDGGSTAGEDSGSGGFTNASVTAATGGDQAAGGSAATPTGNIDTGTGTDGSLGSGGDGAGVSSDGGGSSVSEVAVAGGGGGGGYYGGGAGSAAVGEYGIAPSERDEAVANGGAGGSNYIGGLSTVTTNARGGSTGDGAASISHDAVNTSTYISANYTAEDSVSGFVNLTTVTNSTVTVTFEGWTGSAWTTLNQTAGITTAGNVTYTWAQSDTTKVRVNVTAERTGGSETGEVVMEDEGVTFENDAPLSLDGTASPTGGLASSAQTLSVDVNDPTFGLSQGDTVTVNFSVDGTSIGTDTLTSNGTATQSHTFSGGDHTWSVSLNDSYGGVNSSSTFSVSAPNNLTIREEPAPHPTITGCQAMVTFYEDEQDDPVIINVTDSDSDGSVSLEGLPIDTAFVAVLRCSGYYNRSVIIDSIFDQQTAFLIPTNETTVENRFTLTDFTGRFPPDETEIVIERAINSSVYTGGNQNNFSWVNVAGDDVAADGAFTTRLIEGTRYRIRVQNTDGDQRVLGAYTPAATGTIDLTVGAVDITYTAEDDNIGWSFNQTESDGSEFLQFTYSDPTDATTAVDVLIYERGNESNVIEDTTFSSGPYGNLTLTKNLTALGEENKNWAVEFNATRDGEYLTGTGFSNPDVTVQLPQLDQDWRHIIAVLVLVIVGGAFSQANVDVGAVVVSGVAGIFYMTGFLEGVTSGAAIAVAIGLALFYKWATREPIT